MTQTPNTSPKKPVLPALPKQQLDTASHIIRSLVEAGYRGNDLNNKLTKIALESDRFKLGSPGTTSASGSQQFVDETYMESLYTLARNTVPADSIKKAAYPAQEQLTQLLTRSNIASTDVEASQTALRQIGDKWDQFLATWKTQKDQEYLERRQRPHAPRPPRDPNAPKTRFEEFTRSLSAEEQQLITGLLQPGFKDDHVNQTIIGQVNDRINEEAARRVIGTDAAYTREIQYIMHHLGKEDGPALLAAAKDPKRNTLQITHESITKPNSPRPAVAERTAKINPSLMLKNGIPATVTEYMENVSERLNLFSGYAKQALDAACKTPELSTTVTPTRLEQLASMLPQDIRTVACEAGQVIQAASNSSTTPAPEKKPARKKTSQRRP